MNNCVDTKLTGVKRHPGLGSKSNASARSEGNLHGHLDQGRHHTEITGIQQLRSQQG